MTAGGEIHPTNMGLDGREEEEGREGERRGGKGSYHRPPLPPYTCHYHTAQNRHMEHYFWLEEARVSDEAHFWLNGYVNKQTCRIWSEANPQVIVETPVHTEKLTVSCALWAGGILLQKR
ncbi:hypothetical protein TNCV_2106281 [Trichonephila clavipes]|nr:hypothetical protein TNCV_2106281 [Trichonephila clavipes]